MIVLERVVLASGSPRRVELLRSLGFEVIVAPSGYPEPPMPHLTPAQLAHSHALAKLAAALNERHADTPRHGEPQPRHGEPQPRHGEPQLRHGEPQPRHGEPQPRHGERSRTTTSQPCVVAADTVVDLDREALGKPADAAEATAMLGRLSGRDHLVHTAFALSLPGLDPVSETQTTRVRFHTLTADEIAEYVATGEPLDKAGAYGIQGRAAALVAGIDGDFYTVMGFPLGAFVRTLRRLGFAPPVQNNAR